MGVPTGGRILIDGQRMDGTRFELPPGQYVLTLEAPGYAPQRDTIVVVAGEGLAVRFVAIRIPSTGAMQENVALRQST